MVLFAEQANRVLLLDRPVVECERQAFERRKHQADGRVIRFLGPQILAARGLPLYAVGTITQIVVVNSGIRVFGVLTAIVIQRVRTGDELLVDRDQVRRAEGLRPGAAKQQHVDRPPAECHLADRRVADVVEVFETSRDLDVERLVQR